MYLVPLKYILGICWVVLALCIYIFKGMNMFMLYTYIYVGVGGMRILYMGMIARSERMHQRCSNRSSAPTPSHILLLRKSSGIICMISIIIYVIGIYYNISSHNVMSVHSTIIYILQLYSLEYIGIKLNHIQHILYGVFAIQSSIFVYYYIEQFGAMISGSIKGLLSQIMIYPLLYITSMEYICI